MIPVPRKPRIQVHVAAPTHLGMVEDEVRKADLAEWYAGTGRDPIRAMRECLACPGYKKVALWAGTPVCFWGVSESGEVWLFATDFAVEVALPLHRVLKPELAKLHDISPNLTALSDARNKVHHMWLRWVGFTEVEELAVAPFGLPFKLFRRSVEDIDRPRKEAA